MSQQFSQLLFASILEFSTISMLNTLKLNTILHSQSELLGLDSALFSSSLLYSLSFTGSNSDYGELQKQSIDKKGEGKKEKKVKEELYKSKFKKTMKEKMALLLLRLLPKEVRKEKEKEELQLQLMLMLKQMHFQPKIPSGVAILQYKY